MNSASCGISVDNIQDRVKSSTEDIYHRRFLSLIFSCCSLLLIMQQRMASERRTDESSGSGVDEVSAVTSALSALHESLENGKTMQTFSYFRIPARDTGHYPCCSFSSCYNNLATLIVVKVIITLPNAPNVLQFHLHVGKVPRCPSKRKEGEMELVLKGDDADPNSTASGLKVGSARRTWGPSKSVREPK